MNQMESDLKDSDMCAVNHLYVDDVSGKDLNAMALKYNATLSSVLEHHAPLKIVTKTLRPTVPWKKSSFSVQESCGGKLRENGEELEQWEIYKNLRLEEAM